MEDAEVSRHVRKEYQGFSGLCEHKVRGNGNAHV